MTRIKAYTNRYRQKYRSAGDLMKWLDPIRTQREVGNLLGMTKAQVYQIERVALNKVRQRMREAIGFEL